MHPFFCFCSCSCNQMGTHHLLMLHLGLKTSIFLFLVVAVSSSIVHRSIHLAVNKAMVNDSFTADKLTSQSVVSFGTASNWLADQRSALAQHLVYDHCELSFWPWRQQPNVLQLDYSKPNFLHDTPHQDDTPLYQDRLQKLQWFNRYCSDKIQTHRCRQRQKPAQVIPIYPAPTPYNF